MTRRATVAAALATLLLAAAAGWLWHGRARGARSDAPASAPRVQIPPGARIRVEVINASRVDGLARGAMFYLRDQGFDVVGIATSRERRDSTLVLDRSGRAEWARLVAEALGGARVESRPDSSRYLDVTVLLGAAWRPPAETFHP